MTKDPTVSAFWWRLVFLTIAIIAAIWLVWPKTAEPVAIQDGFPGRDEHNYLGFYQTAVAGWQAYEGNEIMAEITYYTPRPQETSGDPNIMASGEKVFEGAIACPDYLDFGAKVEIDGWEYICHDRMNQRYRAGNYFDVFTFNLQEAIQKGREIKIVKLLD